MNRDKARALVITIEPLQAPRLDELTPGSPLNEIEAALRRASAESVGLDALARAVVRRRWKDRLIELEHKGLAAVVDLAFQSTTAEANRADEVASTLIDPEPWPEPVDGAELLDEVVEIIRRHVATGDGVPDTWALWAAHTWALDCFHVSPVLRIRSPAAECGKTVALTLVGSFCRKEKPAVSVTQGVLARLIDKCGPTVLFDEADNMLFDNRELLAILNSGWKRHHAVYDRCVGDNHDLGSFRTFCPKAFAGIGRLPQTLESRSIITELQRATREELVGLDVLDEYNITEMHLPYRRRFLRWATDHLDEIREAASTRRFGRLSELGARANDNWLPLWAVADVAGGGWLERARSAAKGLALPDEEPEANSALHCLQLLHEWHVEHPGEKGVGTEAFLSWVEKERKESRLNNWANRGRPITPTALAGQLKNFRIERPDSGKIYSGGPRGYMIEYLRPVWERYLSFSLDSPPSTRKPGNKGFFENRGVPPEAQPGTTRKPGRNPETWGLSDDRGQSEGRGAGRPDGESPLFSGLPGRRGGVAEKRRCGHAEYWLNACGDPVCAVCHPPARGTAILRGP